MKRDIDLAEISDGKLYGLNDLVKADCNDCQGCSACCHGMGNSIVLDPRDVYQLTLATKKDFSQLLEGYVELNVVDGIILPNLSLQGDQEACLFLNQQGRCSIHAYRPGICRLFPLGRIYENGGLRYFLQINECSKNSKTKVKVKKWLGVPESKRYQQFIIDWHYFLKDLEEYITTELEPELQKRLNMQQLQQFYMTPYDMSGDFYGEFYQRLQEAKTWMK